MCVLLGYVGNGNAKDLVLEGLKQSEYIAYDSAGIALCHKNQVIVRKKKGQISDLEKLIGEEAWSSHIAIGHTRWATHGEPSDRNSHPHTDMSGRIAVVHNGIIENYKELKEELISEHGSVFLSETDTETVAHLIGIYYEGNLEDAVYQAVQKVDGDYALVVICSEEPDKIVAVRKDRPLIVGLGKQGNYITSNATAILKHSRQFAYIENHDLVLLKKNEVKFFDANRQEVHRDVYNVLWEDPVDKDEKDGYEHLMLKEIYDQPEEVRKILDSKINEQDEIVLDHIELTREQIDSFNRICIVACGSSYHAGLIGKNAIENLARIPVEVAVASEFCYQDPCVDEHTLIIAISESGEKLYTLLALRKAKSLGARVLSVVSLPESTIATESDDVLNTGTDLEKSLFITKTYTSQLVCMYLLAMYMGRKKEVLDEEIYHRILKALRGLPEKMKVMLEKREEITSNSKQFNRDHHVFIIGWGIDSAVAMEGSLKLKEVSHIHSSAISAGELKQGNMALIDERARVIALATQETLFNKMSSAIREVKAHGARVLAVVKEDEVEMCQYSDAVIRIPQCMDEVAPILSIVPFQLLAYDIARFHGYDIDRIHHCILKAY